MGNALGGKVGVESGSDRAGSDPKYQAPQGAESQGQRQWSYHGWCKERRGRSMAMMGTVNGSSWQEAVGSMFQPLLLRIHFTPHQLVESPLHVLIAQGVDDGVEQWGDGCKED